jgi:hypothetical protein
MNPKADSNCALCLQLGFDDQAIRVQLHRRLLRPQFSNEKTKLKPLGPNGDGIVMAHG